MDLRETRKAVIERPTVDEAQVRHRGRRLWGPRASYRTAWTARTAVPPQDHAEEYDNSKQERLNCSRQHQNRLGFAVRQGDVSQVEQWRAVGRPRVHDFKHRLKVAIQVDRWPDAGLESG
jgi:hypothetical protein